MDRYVGDGIVAVFGSPEPDREQYEKALHAAIGMQGKLTELDTVRDAHGKITCGVGIGIRYGEVVQGFIGVSNQMSFSYIGDTMNRAARYCDSAKAGEILISPELYERVWRIVDAAEPITLDSKFREQLSA